MQRQEIHVSDEELLLLEDGELPLSRSAEIRSHLEACWSCRTRVKEIEDTISRLCPMFIVPSLIPNYRRLLGRELCLRRDWRRPALARRRRPGLAVFFLCSLCGPELTLSLSRWWSQAVSRSCIPTRRHS